jgi:hypothetical protein
MIGDKIIVDAVAHPYDLAPSKVTQRVARDEFSQARAQGAPAPWSALRGTALTSCA